MNIQKEIIKRIFNSCSYKGRCVNTNLLCLFGFFVLGFVSHVQKKEEKESSVCGRRKG